MDETQRLKLPLILAAQAQKHVTHNEALRALDCIVQLSVLDRDLAAPPTTPAEGDRYIVATSPTGTWTGHGGDVAAWQGGAWGFYAPQPGWIAWVADEDSLLAWDGASWVVAGGGVNPTPLVGVNATADSTNRLSIKSAASLFDNDGNGHQHKINKAAVGDTASLLFQTGYSGRAEIGTAGDDKLHVKVSPDGSSWSDALVVDPATSNVGVGAATPAAKLHLSSTTEQLRLQSANVSLRCTVSDVGGSNISAFDPVDNGTAGAAFRFFRNIATTGACQIDIYEGSAVIALNARIGGKGVDTFFCITSGNFGIGTGAPTRKLDVNSDSIRVRTAKTPANAAATGVAGEICWDASYIYICTATNTWKRAAIATW